VTNFDSLGSGSVTVLLGKGDGTFGSPQSYVVGLYPQNVAVADFNGDGILDLAVANYGSGTVSILLGKGDGSFSDALNYLAGPGPTWVAVGNFNGDRFPDLAVSISQGVTVLLNAADWAGGAVPPPHRTAHPPRATEAIFALVAASQSKTLTPYVQRFTDVPFNPLQRWPWDLKVDGPTRSEATLRSRPILTAGHVQSTVFEAWDDSEIGAVAWKSLG
jgi:FG-GAP-like repeat